MRPFDLQQHYYWAISTGEKEKEKAMEQQIFKTDDELDDLRKQFESHAHAKKVA